MLQLRGFDRIFKIERNFKLKFFEKYPLLHVISPVQITARTFLVSQSAFSRTLIDSIKSARLFEKTCNNKS